MRYWRSHRHRADVSADRAGRHRRPKSSSRPLEEPYAASPRAERRPGIHRRQPRDSRGRFLSVSGEGVAVVDTGNGTGADAVDNEGRASDYSWSDFELTEELPRTGPRPRDSADRPDGRRHCGELEEILYRQWDIADGVPPPDVVRAVESLAELPDGLKELLAAGLDAIYVGPGGVPELDDMEYLRGRPLPSGQAAWDICAGAYGDRKIVVGDQPSPTPDVMMHEVGHALDDIDGRETAGSDAQPTREWQSDSTEFRHLFDRCLPHLASEFHQQSHELGRREFFADAFAAIASRQRPALVDMLGGNTRAALDVMLYFNLRYGI